MYKPALAVVFILLMHATAAQTPPVQPEAPNKAVNAAGQNNSDKAVKGANSFTEGQAKRRIQEAGYEGVSELKKDDDGVWRAKAMRGRSRFEASVDYQGNVNGRFLESLPSE
jgi:hypothetical protein